MKHKKSILTILTVAVTGTMYAVNHLQYYLYNHHKLLNNPEDQFFDWRFGKIRYHKKGTGKPLLLLHDLTPGSSSYEFHSLFDALAQDYEVYTFDLLGYGLSEKPNITYTNYLYIQLLSDLIKLVIGKKTNIVAVGDTSSIVLNAAHNETDIINKIILINPQDLLLGNQIPSLRTKLMKGILELPIIGTFVYNTIITKSFYQKAFRETYLYDPSAILDKDINAYLEAAHSPDYCSKFVFSSYISKYMNSNCVHALREINNNICILYGEKQEGIDTRMANYLYYNNAIEKACIEKTRHLPHLEKPDAVLKLLQIYLQS